MVRKERLELSRLAALEPKSSASTNSATFALMRLQIKTTVLICKGVQEYPKRLRDASRAAGKLIATAAVTVGTI